MEGGVPSSSIINDLNALEKVLPRLRKTSSPPLLSPPSPSRRVDPTPGRQGAPPHTAGGGPGRASLGGKEETRETLQEVPAASGAAFPRLSSDRWPEPESTGHAGCARGGRLARKQDAPCRRDQRGARRSGEVALGPREGTLLAQ